MRTKFTATKEQAELMLLVLRRNGFKIPEADYDALFNFIAACRSRLPRRDTVARLQVSTNRRVRLARKELS